MGKDEVVKDLVGVRLLGRKQLNKMGLSDFLIRKSIKQGLLHPRKIGRGGRRYYRATEVLGLV